MSILIPNFNHGRFLGACIESAIAQTYTNIEIVVLDNCSTDDSLAVAARYLKDGVRVCRNAGNIINKNFSVVSQLAAGDFLMLLCSDDVIAPTFVEKAMAVMSAHPAVGFVHCDRDYIDGRDTTTELDFFFTTGFRVPGESVLPLFMLTEVALSSQCLMRRSAFTDAGGYETVIDHANADKELWFRMAMVSDYAYVREKLAFIRIHDTRQTGIAFDSFFHPLALYLTIKRQISIGAATGRQAVVENEQRAMEKLAHECIKIAHSVSHGEDRALARRYLRFAGLISPQVVDNPRYLAALSLAQADVPIDARTEDGDVFFSWRRRSYPPPDGFISLTESPDEPN